MELLALSIIGDQLGQSIVVPELVLSESLAYYGRELDAIIENFEGAEEALLSAFETDYVHTEPWPDRDERLNLWREQLLETLALLPLDPADAVAAFQREVAGVPPARKRIPKKPGVGGRDAAIWLSILRDHQQRDETGYFVTKNTSDFLEKDGLKARLQEDVAALSHDLCVHSSIEVLREAVGTSASEIEVDAKTVTRRGLDAVRRGLRESLAVPRAVFSPLGGKRFRTIVRTAEATDVHHAQRFARASESLSMIDAEWSLLVDGYYQEPEDEGESLWGVIKDIKLTGRLQLYLPDETSTREAQLIGAQLQSNKAVTFAERSDLLLISGD